MHVCKVLAIVLTIAVIVVVSAQDDFDIGGGGNPNVGSIVGGQTVTSQDIYPYFVTTSNRVYLCGAVLILPDIVLTAAHCSDAFRPGKDFAIIGAIVSKTGREQIRVTKSRIHPNYNDQNLYNDIMILKLSKNSTATVLPINENPSIPENGKNATVIGFGQLRFDGPVSRTLQQVTLPIVSGEYCSRVYGALTKSELKICAGGSTKDSCGGDSGGPLIDDTTQTLIGLVSSGYKCAVRGVPGLYTRISGMLDNFLYEGICDMTDHPPAFCFPGGTNAPTESPSEATTKSPSKAPTESPTKTPTKSPTTAPTDPPTKAPTDPPTKEPTDLPSKAPIRPPSKAPIRSPYKHPNSSPYKPSIGSYCPVPTNTCFQGGIVGIQLHWSFWGLGCRQFCITSPTQLKWYHFLWMTCGRCRK